MKTLSVIKKKLCSMRYSKKEVQKETSQDAKQFMYGWTECLNAILEYTTKGGDGLPEHTLPNEGKCSLKSEYHPKKMLQTSDEYYKINQLK